MMFSLGRSIDDGAFIYYDLPLSTIPCVGVGVWKRTQHTSPLETDITSGTGSDQFEVKKQVAELKSKLDSAERFLGTLEKERLQSPRESCPTRRWTSEPLRLAEKEKESLNGELHELKIENNLLKEKNALINHKKQHYECEIKRLNKALQDALKLECSSSPEDPLGKSEMECSHEEMRTEMEVLKQQVQIYEEDFKKERLDRERLNQEKEELQRIIQTSQSQLNKLNSQIKACQMEKEKLERQLKQPDYQWYAPDQFPPDVQHKASGLPSEKKASQQTHTRAEEHTGQGQLGGRLPAQCLPGLVTAAAAHPRLHYGCPGTTPLGRNGGRS
ncbi:hypothetical protein MJG53_006125 [Ovis ammon polii x Ovis aries]|uniref:Uncharacterized protein n=1 Tax=Ovis ammon polii x Ovis aries TaxID=2918886 RepID=A0ACB9V8U4_9CETA|nr:hypothetical protein MJG53_006125 [Ovis ammon polii x Ovis aries]